jgi:predicted ATPase
MSMNIKENYIKTVILEENDSEEYFMSIPAISHLTSIEFRKPITFFVGENGTGKSTLLEAIAVSFGFNPEGGSLDFIFNTKDSHSELHDYITIMRGLKRPRDGFFLRAESFYNVATYIEETEKYSGSRVEYARYGGKSLHDQSHGESFMSLMNSRFIGEGIYILDEPEAALSPQRQLSLMIIINKLIKKGSQFIIATHSPILLGMEDADILSFDGYEIDKLDYEETEPYQITKMFIEDRKNILRRISSSNSICNKIIDE